VSEPLLGGDLDIRSTPGTGTTVRIELRPTPTETARAIGSGAAGALDKTADHDELVDAVRRLHRGPAAPS
jgi:DNA-binding NarL/FixJ family response regulator